MSNQVISQIVLQEAAQVYSLIIYNAEEFNELVTAKNLSSFIKAIGSPYEKQALNFLHEIDVLGQPMNKRNFANCLALKIDIKQIFSEEDAINFHNSVKAYFRKEIEFEIPRMQRWDYIHKSSVQYKIALLNQYQNCIQEYRQSLYIVRDKLDENQSKSLNKLLSIINLKSKKEIVEFYREFLKNKKYLADIVSNLSEEILLIYESLKCLSYIYTVYAIDDLRLDLDSCILHEQQNRRILWNTIIKCLSLQNFEVMQQSAILISLISEYVPDFCYYILSEFQILSTICTTFYTFRNDLDLDYCMKFIQNWVKWYRHQLNINKMSDERYLINSMITFPNQVFFKSTSDPVRISSLKAIEQCLSGIYRINGQYQTLESILIYLSLESRSLQVQKQVLNLIFTTISRKYFNDSTNQITLFIYNSTFKKYLLANLTSTNTCYMCLNLIYGIACTDKIDVLYDKQILRRLFSIINIQYQRVNSTVSKIILKIVENAYQTEYRLSFLFENNIIKELCRLMDTNQSDNPVYSLYLDANKSYKDMNDVIFKNSFIALYLLLCDDSTQIELTNRKIAHFREAIAEGQINNISSAGVKFFCSINLKWIEMELREEIPIIKSKVSLKIKFFKLINDFFYEMILKFHNHKFIEYIKTVRRVYLSGLYYIIPIQQLQIQKIPIILSVNIFNNSQIYKFNVVKSDFARFKESIHKKMQAKIQHFQHYDLINRDNNEPLNEAQYDRLLKQKFHDHRLNYQFTFEINLKKQQVEYFHKIPNGLSERPLSPARSQVLRSVRFPQDLNTPPRAQYQYPATQSYQNYNNMFKSVVRQNCRGCNNFVSRLFPTGLCKACNNL